MLPNDFGILHFAAVCLILACWIGYSMILVALARGSLNAKLGIVRNRWMELTTRREAKAFDAILLGHTINSIAFFGSATLLVLAGVITTIANIEQVHRTVTRLPFVAGVSVELFAFQIAVVAAILAISFFSFTYALRKLIYTIALVGALPEKADKHPNHKALVDATAIVLTEAVKSFNFGIRGYYYAVAALCIFVSPTVSITVTALVTLTLFYRQLRTDTASAIQAYVEASEIEETRER